MSNERWRFANDHKHDRLVIVFKRSGAVHGVISAGGEDNPVGLTRRLKVSADDVESFEPWRRISELPEWARSAKSVPKYLRGRVVA